MWPPQAWSSLRQISVMFSSKTPNVIKYTIPIHNERNELGYFKEVQIKDGHIELTFTKKSDKITAE